MHEDAENNIELEAGMLWAGGANVESIIRLMREGGLGQRPSIDVLIRITGLDADEALMAVVESRTWADQHERYLELQDQLAEALRQLAEESRGTSVTIRSEETPPMRSSANPKDLLEIRKTRKARNRHSRDEAVNPARSGIRCPCWQCSF